MVELDCVSQHLDTDRMTNKSLEISEQGVGATLPSRSSTEDLVIPLEYKCTKNYEDFLLYDSGPINQRILIFGTEKSVSYLGKFQDWYMVGTFSVTPKLFCQMYTINAFISGYAVPCLFCLFLDKTEAT